MLKSIFPTVLCLFSFLPGAFAQEGALSQLKEIDLQVDQGHVDKSMMDRVQKIIKNNPDSAQGHYTAGRLLAYFGYDDLAEDEFALADKLDPLHSKAILEVFELRIQKEDLAGAYKLLEFISKRFPDEPSLLMMKGIFLERQGKTTDAEQAYSSALAQEKKVTGVATALASVRLRQGHPDEAISLADRDLSRSPRHFNANLVKGQALLSLGKASKAIPFLEQAHKIKPNNRNLLLIMAVAYYKGKDYEKALPYAFLNLALTTKAAEFASAKLFCAKLVHESTPEAVNRAIDMAENNLTDAVYRSRLHFGLGDMFDHMSRHREASVQYAQGLRYDPESARGWYRLGVDEELFGDFSSAMRFLKKAYDLDPSDLEIRAACLRLATRIVNRERDLAWRIKGLINSSKT